MLAVSNEAFIANNIADKTLRVTRLDKVLKYPILVYVPYLLVNVIIYPSCDVLSLLDPNETSSNNNSFKLSKLDSKSVKFTDCESSFRYLRNYPVLSFCCFSMPDSGT